MGFRRRRLVEAIQFSLAITAGVAAVVPGDAMAAPLTCPVAINTTVSGSDSNSVVCDITTGILTIDSTPGTLTNTGSGTLNNYNKLYNAGSLVNDGTLNNNAWMYNSGSLSNSGTLNTSVFLGNQSGGSLSNSGTLNNNPYGSLWNYTGSSLTNSGTLNNNSYLYNRGDLSNSGTLNVYSPYGYLNNRSGGSVSNTGTVNNYRWIDNNGSLSNAGTLNNYAGLWNYSSGSLTNSGTLNNTDYLFNSGNLSNTGSLVNASGAALNNYNYLSNSGSLSNAGTLNSNYLVNTGSLSNTGTLNNNVYLLNQTGGTLTNDASGTLNNNYLLVNNGSLSNAGSLSNTGQLFNTGSLSNTGTLTGNNNIFNSGSLTNSGTLVNDGPGTIYNSGSFEVTASGTLSGTGNFYQSGGTTVVDGSLTQDLINIYGGTLAGSGTIGSPNTIQIGSGATVTPGAPGGGIGTMTMAGNVDFAGILGIDLASSSMFDFLQVNGWLNFTPGYNIAFALIFPLADPSYNFWFLRANGGISNFNASAFSIAGDYTGYNAALSEVCIDDGYCDLRLTLTQITGNVPEPGTLLLAGLGLGGIAWARRRRHATPPAPT